MILLELLKFYSTAAPGCSVARTPGISSSWSLCNFTLLELEGTSMHISSVPINKFFLSRKHFSRYNAPEIKRTPNKYNAPEIWAHYTATHARQVLSHMWLLHYSPRLPVSTDASAALFFFSSFLSDWLGLSIVKPNASRVFFSKFYYQFCYTASHNMVDIAHPKGHIRQEKPIGNSYRLPQKCALLLHFRCLQVYNLPNAVPCPDLPQFASKAG